MAKRLKIGDCYLNPLLTPFRVSAIVGEIEPVEGKPFDAVIVELAWPREDGGSVLEIVPRATVEGWIGHERTRPISLIDLRYLRKYRGCPLELRGIEREAVEALCLVYGSAGPKYTRGNEQFLRSHLNGQPEKAGHFQPTRECVMDFKRVLDGDYDMLPKSKREALKGQRELNEWMSREKDG